MTKLYKVSELSEILGVTKQTVREWLNTGIIQGIKVGAGNKYWRVTQEQLDAYLKERHG